MQEKPTSNTNGLYLLTFISTVLGLVGVFAGAELMPVAVTFVSLCVAVVCWLRIGRISPKE